MPTQRQSPSRGRTRSPGTKAAVPPLAAAADPSGAPTTPDPAARRSKADDPAQALGASVGELWQSIAGLSVPMGAWADLQAGYLQNASKVWNDTLQAVPGMATWMGAGSGSAAASAFAPLGGSGFAAGPTPTPAPSIGDRRFSGADWAANPAAAYMAQMYLLNARTLMQMAETVEGDAKTRARLRFAVQQWVDAASPANYLALNPEAQHKALSTGGESLTKGLHQLIHDMRQGHVSQTDESVFEVGRNVATSEGSVVYENPLFQLIEYKPLTAKVYERPFLLVPPCINKYYILDLQPDNSLIRYAVEQGHRVFVMSWRNADESLAQTTWDDYIETAAIEAIHVVQQITGCEGRNASVNMLGFCVGGTILATALAVLAARGEQPAASLTMLTSFLDFSDTGILDVFVDEASVQMREVTIGTQSPNRGGLLKGAELASTFSALRPNDLVWNYVVGNYLKGEAPPPFDLLFWNSDSTNLPGPMYCWYLRHTYLQDELKIPGRLTVCGEKVDLGAIQAPAFIYASREDHIVPWTGAYKSTQLLKGKKRFVLGASGHIAGVVNPPAKKKRSHWVGGSPALPAKAEDWLAASQEVPGSWWSNWSEWLASHAGRQVAAPKVPGSRRHTVIEPAPGRYVKAKA